jgi:hypothetical protein
MPFKDMARRIVNETRLTQPAPPTEPAATAAEVPPAIIPSVETPVPEDAGPAVYRDRAGGKLGGGHSEGATYLGTIAANARAVSPE